MPAPIILASKSAGRAAILHSAGIEFEARAADIDERAVEAALGGDANPVDLALILAEAKALAAADTVGAVVIGADQVLEDHASEVLHKATTMDEARRRLLHLQGRTHSLHSGWALARDGAIIASGVETAHMTMRQMDPGRIGRHLSLAGESILGSVGCYQIESVGIRLFDAIDGDHFTIIGMPMIPLLAALRRTGALDD